jgi:fatty acid desaturase
MRIDVTVETINDRTIRYLLVSLALLVGIYLFVMPTFAANNYNIYAPIVAMAIVAMAIVAMAIVAMAIVAMAIVAMVAKCGSVSSYNIATIYKYDK